MRILFAPDLIDYCANLS